jgi:hypothetical protein
VIKVGFSQDPSDRVRFIRHHRRSKPARQKRAVPAYALPRTNTGTDESNSMTIATQTKNGRSNTNKMRAAENLERVSHAPPP